MAWTVLDQHRLLARRYTETGRRHQRLVDDVGQIGIFEAVCSYAQSETDSVVILTHPGSLSVSSKSTAGLPTICRLIQSFGQNMFQSWLLAKMASFKPSHLSNGCNSLLMKPGSTCRSSRSVPCMTLTCVGTILRFKAYYISLSCDCRTLTIV